MSYFQRMSWLLPLVLKFTAPDFEHVTVSHRALILLRHLSPTATSFLEKKVIETVQTY